MPKMTPFARKNHERRIHTLVMTIHLVSSLPLSRAEMANANGTVNAVKPRYNVGGWMVIQ